MTHNNLLFICSTDNQVKNFLPIYQKLKEENYPASFLVLDTYYNQGAGKLLDKHAIAYYTLTNKSKTSFYKNSFIKIYLTILFEIQPQIRHIFQIYSPAMIILGNDRGLIEKCFIHEGHYANISSIMLQDGIQYADDKGIIKFNDLFYGTVKENWKRLFKNTSKAILRKTLQIVNLNYLAPGIMGQGNTDIIAATGISSANIFQKRKSRDTQIIITGQPKYDTWAKIINSSPKEKQQLKVDLGLHPAQKTITFLTTALLPILHDVKAHQLQMLELVQVSRLLKQLDQNETWQIALKIHPRENAQEYSDFIRKKELSNVTFTNPDELVDLLTITDVAFAIFSTAIVESLLCSVPVILTLTQFDGSWVRNFTYDTQISTISTIEQMRGFLKNIIIDSTILDILYQEEEGFLHTYCDINGNATDKVFSLIQEKLKTANNT